MLVGSTYNNSIMDNRFLAGPKSMLKISDNFSEDDSQPSQPDEFQKSLQASSGKTLETPSLPSVKPMKLEVAKDSQSDDLVDRVVVDDSARQQVLQNFLKRMHEEFGLSAEQVVKAFSSLTSEELQQPPEMNLDKLVAALPLDPQQQQLAKMFFYEMLKETASHEMADYLKTSHRQLSLEVLSQNEIREKQRYKSVEDMQNKFFKTFKMQSHPKVTKDLESSLATDRSMNFEGGEETQMVPQGVSTIPSGTTLDPAQDQNTSSSSPRPSLSWDSQSGLMTTTQDLQNHLSVLPVDENLQASQTLPENSSPSTKVLPSPTQQMGDSLQNAVSPEKNQEIYINNFYRFDVPKSASGPLMEADNINSVDENTESEQNVISEPRSTTKNIDNVRLIGEQGLTMKEKTRHSESEDLNQENSSYLDQPQDHKSIEGSSAVIGKETFNVNRHPDGIQSAANIKEIVSHAQFLAQKGGGEMKITLAPEGLGQVSMKVVTQGGQVSIQMVADSTEAKRIIEKGLADLRTTLIAHDLRVDQIRVDTPSDISKHLQQNHDEAQRQFAQQFMNQFQQENSEWRRGFYDIPGARAYRSQKEEAEKSFQLSSANSTANSKRENRHRRLDLVA